ncbi:hypothetical protein EAE99_001738 [Botrytis elliptica]|nr:hypothetical protein EAE99_001738 [Botrytis elliptica]
MFARKGSDAMGIVGMRTITLPSEMERRMIGEIIEDMTDAAWELEKVAVMDWTATGDGSPSFGNHGFPECIRGSEMTDATRSIITMGETMSALLLSVSRRRSLQGKDSDSISIGFNGITLFVWENRNTNRRKGEVLS